MSPFFGWVSNGKEACCNFCGHYFDVPHLYYCSLNDRGERRDQDDRPELCCGTVDYIAPKEYYMPTQAEGEKRAKKSVGGGAGR